MEKDLKNERDTPLWIFSVPASVASQGVASESVASKDVGNNMGRNMEGKKGGEQEQERQDVGMGGLVLHAEGQRYMADRESRTVKLCEFLSCFSFSWSYNYDCDVDDGDDDDDDDDDDDEGEMSTLHCVSFHHVASLLPFVSCSLLFSRVEFKGVTLNLDSRVFFPRTSDGNLDLDSNINFRLRRWILILIGDLSTSLSCRSFTSSPFHQRLAASSPSSRFSTSLFPLC
jgi:hypothetical protein